MKGADATPLVVVPPCCHGIAGEADRLARHRRALAASVAATVAALA